MRSFVHLQKIWKKKVFLFFLVFVLLFGTFFQKNVTSNILFHHISDEIMKDFLSTDEFDLAFCLANRPHSDKILPFYNKQNYLDSNQVSYFKKLSSLSNKYLSSKNQALYNLLTDYYKRQELTQNYLYLENPFSPTNGVHITLPVLLSEYPLNKKDDLSTYLSILSSIPNYFDSLISYCEDGKNQGILISCEDINEAIRQCDTLSTKQGETLFLSQFQMRLDEYVNKKPNSISKKEQAQYLKKAKKIITTSLCPAYEKLGDKLLIIKEEGVERKGLKDRNLADYYTCLLANKTGTDHSLKEIEALLQSRFFELANKYNLLLQSVNPSDFDIKTFNSYPEKDAEKMLHTLMQNMKKDFPALPSGISYRVKKVPKSLEDYTAPAYYFSPQIDCYTDNNIYINQSQITDALSLFTTLAHEGYPGHMLQTTYFYNNCFKKNLSSKDTILINSVNYPGYVEGWAMYVEFLSYSYASAYVISKQNNATEEEIKNYISLLQLNKELKICLYCLLDLRVNIYGDQSSDLIAYLKNIGISDPAYSTSLYRYLTNEPATYASYYVGYLELLDCLSYYNDQCKKYHLKSSLKEFHSLYLEAGPNSFTNIKRNIHSFLCTKSYANAKYFCILK